MQKMIVWGNCQAEALIHVLSLVPQSAEAFEIIYQKSYVSAAEQQEQLIQFETADVFIRQTLFEWRNHPLRETLPEKLRVITFPLCYLGAMWPFDSFIFGNDNVMIASGAPFAFQDGLMARLRTEFPDPEERLARYISLDFPKPPDLRRNSAFDANRLLRSDENHGMTIGHLMLDTFRTERLFHTITHPAPPVVEHVAWEVLKALDLTLLRSDVPKFPDFMGYYQVPVHPRIIDHFGLSYVGPLTEYAFSPTERLTFEQYFRRYIEAAG